MFSKPKRKLVATPKGLRVQLPVNRNAAPQDQKAWNMLPSHAKRRMQRTMRDDDRRVPNGYDCHMRDRKRSDDFETVHQSWLDEHPSIEIRDTIVGRGTNGEVHNIGDTSRLVAKTAIGYGKSCHKGANKSFCPSRDKVEQEANKVRDFNTNSIPLAIPSKVYSIPKSKKCPHGSNSCVAIVRPRVMVAENELDHDDVRTTNRKFQQMSNAGFELISTGDRSKPDNLEIGKTPEGNVHLYDLGNIDRKRSVSSTNNSRSWDSFLKDRGHDWAEGSISNAKKKFGSVL